MSRTRPAAAWPSPAAVCWAVHRVARLLGGANCLAEALAIRFLLARHGRPAAVRIRLERAASGGVRVHAWVDSGTFTTDCGDVIVVSATPESLRPVPRPRR